MQIYINQNTHHVFHFIGYFIHQLFVTGNANYITVIIFANKYYTALCTCLPAGRLAKPQTPACIGQAFQVVIVPALFVFYVVRAFNFFLLN